MKFIWDLLQSLQTILYLEQKSIKDMQLYKKTIVHKGATVGANATIVCGHDIGQYVMVAGAVVLGDVLPYALMAGVPAKKIGWVCECGELLPYGLKCPKCGKAYEVVNKELKPL